MDPLSPKVILADKRTNKQTDGQTTGLKELDRLSVCTLHNFQDRPEGHLCVSCTKKMYLGHKGLWLVVGGLSSECSSDAQRNLTFQIRTPTQYG